MSENSERYVYKGREIHPTVEIIHDLIPFLGGIPMRTFFTDTERYAMAWRTADRKIRDVFGDRLKMRKPAPPPLSYGHLACIGADLCFPEDGEPNIVPPAHSVGEAVKLVRECRRFEDSTLFKRYIDFWRLLREEFPGEDIPFSGLGLEGPVTSAELFRGQDFFLELMDEPESVKEYLEVMTDSIVRFARLVRKINGQPGINPSGTGLADDIASMIHQNQWDEFVIPYWDRYYSGLTTGSRSLHCEDMRPAQLKYLKKAGITHYQPSVSDRLTPEIIRSETGVPFDWLLYSYRITDMSDGEIGNFVERTLAAGVTTVRTQLGAYAWQRGKTDRILAFLRAFDRYRIA